MTSPCRGCKLSGRAASFGKGVKKKRKKTDIAAPSIEPMSETQILAEVVKRQSMRTWKERGCASQEAAEEALKGPLGRLPAMHVIFFLEPSRQIF